jgi:hypothetical protein
MRRRTSDGRSRGKYVVGATGSSLSGNNDDNNEQDQPSRLNRCLVGSAGRVHPEAFHRPSIQV